MTNNDILRRVRYALDISNIRMLEIFRLAGEEIELATLLDMLKKEDEEGYRECGYQLLEAFLDGLIIQRRGKQQDPDGAHAARGTQMLTNNLILRKLRIALELKDDDMVAMLKLAGVPVSKSELGALFRNQGHKNYKKCGDQFLRNFLKGLTAHTRGIPVTQ